MIRTGVGFGSGTETKHDRLYFRTDSQTSSAFRRGCKDIQQLLITGTMGREAEAQIIDTGIHTCTCYPPTYMWQPTSVHKLIGVNMNHQDISIFCGWTIGCVVDCTCHF